MFTERWWIGLLIGVMVAVPMYYLAPRPEPIYRADVSVLFESKKNRILGMQEVVDTTLRTDTELNTHIEQLNSKTFLDYLLSSFTPEEAKRVQQAYLDPLKPDAAPPSLAEIIRPNVRIYTRRGTTIIGIGVLNRDPESAALIANRYARKYIDFNLDRANTGTTSAIVFLRNQAEEMRVEVEAAETALQVYRAKNGMASLGETKDVTLQKVGSLGSTSVGAQLQQIETKSLLDKIAEYQKAGRDLLEISQISSSAQVAAAKTMLTNLDTERNTLAQRYLSKHPKIIENEFASQEAKRLLEEGIAKTIASLRTRFELATQHIDRLQTEMGATETHVRQLDKISVDYKFLEQDAQIKRTSYTHIVDRLGEAKITSQLENTTIKVFDSALVPSTPSETGSGKIVTQAAAAGVLCLLVFPIGLGLMDSRIRTPDQVERNLGQKLLGAIKPLRKLTEQQRANAFRLGSDVALTESWRGIYSEIELCSSIGYPRIIMVCSSLPGEGKSQICSNLAAVFATHNRRVLLIDCDLRRPCLHRYFERPETRGWVDWLQEPEATRSPSPDTTVNIDINLDLLPAGVTPQDPTEMVERLCLPETLKKIASGYDVVIFDTPPAMVFPDALLLARACHELVYVLRYRTVPTKIVQHALQRFGETGISMLGLVLNRLPETKMAGYGTYYGYGAYRAEYYKKYGEQHKKRPSAA